MAPVRPRVLLVDAYDSYSYNIYQLLLDVLPDADIIVVRHDQYTSKQIDEEFVNAFDFLLIGPGPGDPRQPADVGFLLKLFDFDVPILGICLGFQLLCLRFGGTIAHLEQVKHGQISQIHVRPGNLYDSAEPLEVTRYHSIAASIPPDSSELEELAYVDDASPNGRVCMAARHRIKPFYAVQYHAESCCSAGGPALVRNFWLLAQDWNATQRPTRASVPAHLTSSDVRPKPLVRGGTFRSSTVDYAVLNGSLTASEAAEVLGTHRGERIALMESVAVPGRFSILGVLDETDRQVTYDLASRKLNFLGSAESCNIDTAWRRIAAYAAAHKLAGGPPGSPFFGGFIGYFSYEAGVATLNVKPAEAVSRAPDINLALVSRSIVFDREEETIFVQSARRALHGGAADDSAWLQATTETLRQAIAHSKDDAPKLRTVSPTRDGVRVTIPERKDYVAKVKRAQDFLAKGDSYELCLTGQTGIECPRQDAWTLYRTLRQRNPAPYACCIKLPGVTLVSSSPERFVSVSRDGACQLRPIKGTVRKTPGMTRAKATAILRTPKELAENLMIVDLIRHDLHQIARGVSVRSLMSVEEYETVYQLVSVIEGRIKAPFTCIDVLKHSLPPGSMTGAPKKRSVEILAGLEQRNRGIYSGVCGYLSFCGASDWSVVIRSAFRYDCEQDTASDRDVWHVGAGGAITALSDPEAEYDEMRTKLESALPAFGVVPNTI